MIKYVYRGQVLFLLILSIQCGAYIYELTTLVKASKEPQKQYIVFFSDFHDKKLPINQIQSQKIAYTLRRCHPFFVAVLTEDLSSQGHGGNHGCGKYTLNSLGGVLGGLATRCRSYGLQVINLEYRYCRVVAFGPAANSVHVRTNGMQNCPGSITIQELLDEIQGVVQEIQRYDDGPFLNEQYKKSIKAIQHDIELLTLPASRHMLVHDFLTNYVPYTQDKAAALKNLLTFDSELLDLKMVHAIVANSSAHYVLVFAGGSHVDRAAALLKKSGYQEVRTTGAHWYREYDTRKCSGIARPQGFCSMPRPISQRFLDDVLEKLRWHKEL